MALSIAASDSSASEFDDCTALTACTSPPGSGGSPPHPPGVFACDVTGDGLADLLFFDDSGIQVYKAVK